MIFINITLTTIQAHNPIYFFFILNIFYTVTIYFLSYIVTIVEGVTVSTAVGATIEEDCLNVCSTKHVMYVKLKSLKHHYVELACC